MGDQVGPWWLDRRMWTEAAADTPYGHCAGCGQDLPIRDGADGSVIVPLGHCYDCDLTTVWDIIAMPTEPSSSARGEDRPETNEERAAALYRTANAICDTQLKTAIELRQLAGKIERGEA